MLMELKVREDLLLRINKDRVCVLLMEETQKYLNIYVLLSINKEL